MKADQKKYQKKYYEDNKKKILNLRKKYREINKEKINIWQRQYYENHKEELNFQHKEYYKNHMEEMKFYQKQHHNALRLEILHYYSKDSMQCACCGEDILYFLAIDHINGGGNKHYKELIEKGTTLDQYLINNNFPPGYRILCHNCNSSLGAYGYCPHNNIIPTEVGYKYTEIDEEMFL